MSASESAAADRPANVPTANRRAAVLATAVVLIAACSDADGTAVTAPPASSADRDTVSGTTAGSGTSAVSTPTADSAPARTVPPATDATTVAGPTTAPAIDLDAEATFADALAATSTGYRFASTATVGDRVALTAEGDHTPAGTRLRVVSQGASVDYLVVDGRSWVFDDGVWQELDDGSAVGAPLAQLGDPIAVVVTSVDGDLTRLLASYPAAALGLTGEDVGVIVEIVGGRIVTLEYAAAGDGPIAVVRTELASASEPAPTITAPDA